MGYELGINGTWMGGIPNNLVGFTPNLWPSVCHLWLDREQCVQPANLRGFPYMFRQAHFDWRGNLELRWDQPCMYVYIYIFIIYLCDPLWIMKNGLVSLPTWSSNDDKRKQEYQEWRGWGQWTLERGTGYETFLGLGLHRETVIIQSWLPKGRLFLKKEPTIRRLPSTAFYIYSIRLHHKKSSSPIDR